MNEVKDDGVLYVIRFVSNLSSERFERFCHSADEALDLIKASEDLALSYEVDLCPLTDDEKPEPVVCDAKVVPASSLKGPNPWASKFNNGNDKALGIDITKFKAKKTKARGKKRGPGRPKGSKNKVKMAS